MAIEAFYSSLTQQKQLDLVLSERVLGGERFVDGQTPLYGIFLRSTQRTTHSRGPSVSIALNTSSLQIQILTITVLSTITSVSFSLMNCVRVSHCKFNLLPLPGAIMVSA